MRLEVMTLYVDDQDKALRFYTENLGFQKKTDAGSGLRLDDTCGNLMRLTQLEWG